MRYRLAEKLIPLKEGELFGEDDIQIELLTKAAFAQETISVAHKSILSNMLLHSRYCRAEVYSGSILGTLMIPNKENPVIMGAELGFYMTKERLLFVEDGSFVKNLFGRLKKNSYAENGSCSAVMADVLHSIVEEDAVYLHECEGRLIELEEHLLKTQKISKKTQHTVYEAIIKHRKDLMRLHASFSQMEDLGEMFCSNINHVLSEEEIHQFTVYTHHVGRLLSHTRMLREYVIQIYDMYQSQMDMLQSHSMNLLAVVTTIFLPLSLLVGWYGMNFTNMPELRWEYGYYCAILVSLITVLIEIYIFRKKHLL